MDLFYDLQLWFVFNIYVDQKFNVEIYLRNDASQCHLHVFSWKNTTLFSVRVYALLNRLWDREARSTPMDSFLARSCGPAVSILSSVMTFLFARVIGTSRGFCLSRNIPLQLRRKFFYSP